MITFWRQKNFCCFHLPNQLDNNNEEEYNQERNMMNSPPSLGQEDEFGQNSIKKRRNVPSGSGFRDDDRAFEIPQTFMPQPSLAEFDASTYKAPSGIPMRRKYESSSSIITEFLVQLGPVGEKIDRFRKRKDFGDMIQQWLLIACTTACICFFCGIFFISLVYYITKPITRRGYETVKEKLPVYGHRVQETSKGLLERVISFGISKFFNGHLGDPEKSRERNAHEELFGTKPMPAVKDADLQMRREAPQQQAAQPQQPSNPQTTNAQPQPEPVRERTEDMEKPLFKSKKGKKDRAKKPKNDEINFKQYLKELQQEHA